MTRKMHRTFTRNSLQMYKMHCTFTHNSLRNVPHFHSQFVAECFALLLTIQWGFKYTALSLAIRCRCIKCTASSLAIRCRYLKSTALSLAIRCRCIKCTALLLTIRWGLKIYRTFAHSFSSCNLLFLLLNSEYLLMPLSQKQFYFPPAMYLLLKNVLKLVDVNES